MIYNFRIISDEEKEFIRDLEISGTATFLDFHEAIQKELNYDSSQLASFFLTDEGWEKELEITLIDMMSDSEQPGIIMKDAVIQDYISTARERMLYVFDFFSERAFFIECMEIKTEDKNVQYPHISFRLGDPPTQIELGLENLSDEDEDVYLNDFFSNEDQDEDIQNEEGFDGFYPED